MDRTATPCISAVGIHQAWRVCGEARPGMDSRQIEYHSVQVLFKKFVSLQEVSPWLA